MVSKFPPTRVPVTGSPAVKRAVYSAGSLRHLDRLDLHQRPAEVLGAAGIAEVVVPVQQRSVDAARDPRALERQMQVGDVAEPDQGLGVGPGRLDVQPVGDPVGALATPGGEHGSYAGIAERLVQVRQSSLVVSGEIAQLVEGVPADLDPQSPGLQQLDSTGHPVAGGWAGRERPAGRDLPCEPGAPSPVDPAPCRLLRLGRPGQVGHDQPQLPIEGRTGELGVRCPARRAGEGGIAIDGPDLRRCAEIECGTQAQGVEHRDGHDQVVAGQTGAGPAAARPAGRTGPA